MAQSFAAAQRGQSWQAIYASPLQRAIATARPTAEQAQMQVTVRPDLQEIAFGDWEGKTVEAVHQAYLEDHLRWLADPGWNAPTGGETAVAVAERVLRLINEVQQRFTDGNVLIVSHKATIRIALCSLLGLDVGRYRFRLDCPVGSLSVVELRKQGPFLLRHADRSHFSADLHGLPGT